MIAEGDFAKHGIHSRARSCQPHGGEVESRYAEQRGALGAGRRLGCQARILRRSRRRRAAREPGPSPGRPQARRGRSAIEIDPVVRLHYVEVAEPDMHEPASDLRRLQRGAPRAMAACRADADLADACQACRRRCAQGDWKVTAAVRKGRDIVARLARLRRARLRPRRRRRLDHDRRPSLRSRERRGRRRRRSDEPADPLRRGSDEPGLLRDDEPGRRPGADAGRARGDRRARSARPRERPASRAARSWS